MADRWKQAGLSYAELREREFKVVAELHKLRELARRLQIGEVDETIDLALRRIESQNFSIAVVGEFKRGKSTFINALLGKEILPADIAPTSATLNRVTYGTRPAIRIVLREGVDSTGMPESIDIDQLANYVTKLTPDAEAMAAKVKEAIVYYPSRFCQNNVSIIDTPGLSDDAAMTAITLEVLPQVDAAILVIMPESPFAGSEGNFLNQHLLADVGRVFFVVTATDRIRRAEDRERILTYVAKRISDSVERFASEKFAAGSVEYEGYVKQASNPRIFGLSGYEALHGKIENNANRVEASGIRAFEATLEQFLTEERGLITLQYSIERVMSIGHQIDEQIAAQQRAIMHQREACEVAYREARAILAELRLAYASESKAIEALNERLQTHLLSEIEGLVARLAEVAGAEIEKASITSNELNKAGVGAVGGAIGALAGKIPDNLKGGALNGLRKGFGKLPPNLQNAGQQMRSGIAEKGQAGVQQYARSEAIDDLARSVAALVNGALNVWLAATQDAIHALLAQAVAQAETLLAGAEQELAALQVQLLADGAPINRERSAHAPRLEPMPVLMLPVLDEVRVDFRQLARKSAAQTVVSSIAPKEGSTRGKVVASATAAESEEAGANGGAADSGQAIVAGEEDRLAAFKRSFRSAIQNSLAAELAEREIAQRALDALSTHAGEVQAGLAGRLAIQAQRSEQTLEKLDRKHPVETARLEWENRALQDARVEVHSRLEVATRLSADLLQS